MIKLTYLSLLDIPLDIIPPVPPNVNYYLINHVTDTATVPSFG